MESYLIENEGVLALDHNLFTDVEIIEAELTLKEGRKSKETDGRIDILASYSQEYLAVVELKLGQLEEMHLSQLEDYLQSRETLVEKYKDLIKDSFSDRPKWLGVLVGASINPKLAEKINNGYQANGNIPIAALTIQRYRGNDGQIYVVTEPLFNSNQSKKDTQKYIFNELEFGKSRLVLEVIKSYVANHPEITFNQLASQFSPNIQGKSGTFTTIEKANEIYTKTGHKRHYIKPEEQLKLFDCTIAVSNQWGIGNINGFINNARKLGYKIKLVNS
ncbi:MAG: hypothetical protein KME09_01340 [Pleurocapsa minor HA4230-MV1]|jgi:hypothetical protein|nr:hypothetical protein [Pleurocapsa minor HA4230-MV1]